MKLNDIFRLDSWTNLITGLGTMMDKTSANQMMPDLFRTDPELESHWNYNGIGHKIISAKADDMTREWIEIPGDPSGLILDDLASLDAQTHVNLALKWQRLFGGALLVMGIKDGSADLETPLSASGGEVQWLKVYDRSRIVWQQQDIVVDPSKPRFEDFEVYTVMRMDGTHMRVHHTRCIPFYGIPVPKSMWVSTDIIRRYWGMSVLQPIYQELAALGTAYKGIEGLMDEYSISTFTFDNLRDIVSDSANGLSKLMNRANAMASTKSMIRSVFLGPGETWRRETVSLAGVGDVLDRFAIMLCAVSSYPATRLFGRSPAGMNATGESDERNYYDDVKSEQQTKLRPALARLITAVAKGKKRSWEKESSKKGTKGATTTTRDLVPFEFKALHTPTLKELLEAKKIQADIDGVYIDKQVYGPEEVRDNRFRDEYSFDMHVEGDLEVEEPDSEMDPAMILAAAAGSTGQPPKPSGKGAVLPPSRPGQRQAPKPNDGKPTK